MVTAKYIVDGFKLGNWVSSQRSNKDKLSKDRIKRLDALGFSWDPFTEQWEEGFRKFLQFQEREGHCLVSQRHREDDFNLGIWVSRQRRKKTNSLKTKLRD